MNRPRRILIRAQYERCPAYGRSLRWIAPELADAGLTLVEDRIHEARPSRAWTGIVDGPTFDQFAKAWRLPDDSRERGSSTSKENGPQPVHTYVFDGLSWESQDESPIISVTLQVLDVNAAAAGERRPSVEA